MKKTAAPVTVKASGSFGAYLDTVKTEEPLFRDVQRHVLLLAANNDRDQTVMHPSEMVKSDWCHRATYHRLRTPTPPPAASTTFQRENIFQEGHNTHSKWQKWFADIGRLTGDWKCNACFHVWWEEGTPNECPECVAPYQCIVYAEVPLNAHPLRISGKSDGFCHEDGCLIEIKTLGLGSVRFEMPDFLEKYEIAQGNARGYDLTNLWRDLHRPMPAAVKQGQLYMYLAKHFEDLLVDRCVYFYDYKPTQETKTFTVYYDESIAEPYIDAAQQILACIEDEYPPFCNNGGRAGCKHCKPYEDKK